ncbi:MAG TPA: FKBP-type peptidyl-prolyl cis-trans isomerase, partial [Alphaproteobacteria bacterium]|nr:FKBP-type peptidyl-prolyl cis-trans isomerase [Alphaproteobacteria bacterium]
YSYAIGFQIGSSLRERVTDVDTGMLAKGVEEALGGAQPRLSSEEMQSALQAYDQLQQQKVEAEAEAAAEEGRAFLEANRQKEGMQQTESGLQYQVLEEGHGEQPDVDDTVVVHYRGTLLDGEEFDSSYARGEPARFPVGAVIPGWQEALQMMQPGAKWKIFVPPQLAYGERGAGDVIGPNQTLIFEIELLEVVSGDGEQPAPEGQ